MKNPTRRPRPPSPPRKRLLLEPYRSGRGQLQQRLGDHFRAPVRLRRPVFSVLAAASRVASRKASSSRGSFDIEQGVGVRAMSGDKTAFAYSDDISLDVADRSARYRRARSRAMAQRQGQSRVERRACARSRRATQTSDPVRVARAAGQGRAARASRAAGARARPAREAGDGERRRPNTTSCWSRAATACWRPTCGRWCACRSR